MKKKALLILTIIIFIVATSLLLFACKTEAKIDALQLISFGQTEYNQGDPLVFEGSSLVIRYQNGTEEKVMIDSSMVSSYDPNKLGEQYVVISYKGKSVAYKITVNKPRIATINIDLKPENVNYIEGQNFNPIGAELVATYENDTEGRIPLENYMVTGFDKNLIGTQSLVVKYRENFASGDYKDHFLNVQVTVAKKEIQSIEVFQSPRITTYFLGEATPSFDGGVLLVKYNNLYTDKINFIKDDGSGELIENLSYTWNSSIVSESTFVNLSYYDEQKDINHETRYAIKIRERDVKEYKFLDVADNSIGQSLSLTQVQNAEFSFGDYKIQIEYNDEQTYETIVFSESPERYIVTEYNDQSFILQTSYLQIKYSGIVLKKKIPIQVTVIPEIVSSIELIDIPDLYVDTVLNYKFWSFRYVYNSGNVSEQSAVGENVEISYRGEDNVLHKFSDLATVTFNEAGTYSIVAELSADSTITYEGEIQINPMEIEKVELIGSPMLEAYYEDAIVDPRDAKIKVTYKNGLCKTNIQVTSDMISFNPYVLGGSKATITYEDPDYNISGSVQIDIEITNKIPEIEITSNPKLTYFINEEFDYSNMTIKFKYASDTSTEIVRQGLAITSEGFYFSIEGQSEGFSFVNEGAVTVYLRHKGMVHPIPIPVTVIKTPIEIGYLFYQGNNEEGEFISEPRGNSFGDVIEGLDIDLTNLYVEIKFEGSNDFENVKLTKEMLSYRKENTALGNRFVSITYPFDANAEDQIVGDGYTVNVIEKEVVALEIPQGSTPRMTEYTRNETVGATEEFVYFGLRIIKKYSNETTEEIDLNNSEFDFARVPLNVPAGTPVDIKISYLFDSNVFVYYTVTVVEQRVQEVIWAEEANTDVAWYNGMPTVYVIEGQEIDYMNLYAELTGVGGLATSFDHLKITEIGTGGDTRTVPYTIAKNSITQVLDYQKEQGPTEQFINLLYKGKELPVRVIVKSSVLYSIEIDEENINKIRAVAGGDLIIDDTYFIAVYRAEGAIGEGHGQSTEKRSFIKLELSHIQISENNPGGYDKTDVTLNKRNVTIYYLGKTSEEIEINVVEKEVESIIVGSLFKNAFVEGEEFSYVSASNPSAYPTLQVNYTNGQTNGVVQHIDGEDQIVFPTVYQLVQEGTLVVDYSSFDSSDFDGAPKTQTINLIYTSTYGTATYSYNVIVYNKKTALFEITIPYPSGKNSFIYGESSEPTFTVTGYSTVLTLTEDGSYKEDDSPATTPLTKGYLYSGSIEDGFYYVFYIPSNVFVSTNLVYQTLFDTELTKNNLLTSTSSQCQALREYTKFPSNVGTYKIVVRSFGDAVHNSFIYDHRNRADLEDIRIEKREIYINVLPETKIYGKSMPEYLLIELRTSENAEILENPMEVFAEQDRSQGFGAPGFSGTNTQVEKTSVKIANKTGGVLDGSDIYDCFDIIYETTSQGQKRALAYNEPVAIYQVTINPVLENPNYNLIYMASTFTITKRLVNVYPKSGISPTWQHGHPRPSIEYDTSRLSNGEFNAFIKASIKALPAENAATLIEELFAKEAKALIKALIEASLSAREAKSLTTEEIKTLIGVLIGALPTEEAESLTTEEIKTLIGVLIEGLPAEEVETLSNEKIKTLIKVLPTEEVATLSNAEIKALIKTLTKTLIGASIEGLTNENAEALIVELIGLFSFEEVKVLINALSDEDPEALSEEEARAKIKTLIEALLEEVPAGGFSVGDTGLLFDDVLTGSLLPTLNLASEEGILAQLLAKAESDPENVIGYTTINSGTLANNNYSFILKNHTTVSEDPVYVKYLKRTIYIKPKSQVRVYGSSLEDFEIELIFTKQAAGDVTEDDAFALQSDNTREKLSDIISKLSHKYYTVNPITYGETLISEKISEIQAGSSSIYLTPGITSNIQVGSVAIYLSIPVEGAGSKFNLYDVKFARGEIKTTKRNVLIKPQDATKIFGEDDPAFNFSTAGIEGEVDSGLLSGDSLSVGEGKLTRVPGENVGSYKILLGTLGENNTNYNLILGQDSVLTIETKKIYVGFNLSGLKKEYDGLKAEVSKSSMILYSKNANNEYIVIDDFDVNNISLSLSETSKNVGFYEIVVSSLNPNYQVFLKPLSSYSADDLANYAGPIEDAEGNPIDLVSYVIYQKAVEVELLHEESIVENNSNLEYVASGYALNFAVKPEQLSQVYDESGEPIVEDGQLKRDSVSIQLIATIDGDEILGNTITDIGSYIITPSSTLTNSNYKLKTVDEEGNPINHTFYIQIVAKTLFVKLKNANAETHLISREYNGRAIEITSQDYDIIPYISPSLRPALSLGIIGEAEPPRNVLTDQNGDILSYDVGIIQNSNNPNYIYELYYQDYEYQIRPKVAILQISSNNLQQDYNGMTPFIREFNITGTVQGEILNNENILFSFIREANDNRANSDAGRYQVSARSLNPNYSINLYQDYVFTILKSKSFVRLNKTGTYDPLKKEFIAGAEDLPFLQPSDFIFSEAVPPGIRNFKGLENSDGKGKNQYIEKLDFLTTGVSRVRSAFYALNMQGSKEALENGINIAKSTIDEVITETTIQHASFFSNFLGSSEFADSLFYNLNTLKTRIDEISEAYNLGYTGMKQKFDELLVFVNASSSIIDRENNYISFTFDEDWPAGGFAVNQVFNFVFESHGYNIEYRWNQSLFVSIIKRRLQLKVQDIEKKYGEIPEESQIVIDYEIYDSKGDLADVLLTGQPNVLNFNRNCGTYNISIDQMIVDNSEKYQISLHPSTLQPKFSIIKNNVTVVMLDVGTAGDFIYGTTVAISTINSYRYLDIYDDGDKEKAVEYYEEIFGTTPTDEELLEFFGKRYFSDEIGSSYPGSVINTSSAIHHLYLASEFAQGIYNDKLGFSILDCDDYKICVENYFSTNYEVRVLPGLLRISRATANLEVQPGNILSRKYSQVFSFTFNFPSLPLGASADLMLNKLDGVTGDLTPVGLISEFSNIFIDYNQTTAEELTALETGVAVDLSSHKLYLTNIYEGAEIVTKNYKFSFDSSGYGVLITQKELYLTVTDMDDNQNMTVEYGTFDNPYGVAGSNNNNYKITYEGFASWDAETINPGVNLQPGKENAPQFNLYSVASTTPKIISISDMTWSIQSSHNVLQNYTPLVVDGSMLTTTKKEVQIEINPEKLKTAIKFYTYSPLSGSFTFSNMTIYPYLSEIVELYNENPVNPKSIYESYKIIGGTYGPMDFRFKAGFQAAYQEKLHSATSDVLNRGEFNLDILPYVGKVPAEETVGTEGDKRRTVREVNKVETLFNHKITVVKTATGWKVTVSNFSPTSNYFVPNQVVEFTDAEVNYIYQVVDILPAKKNIFYSTNYSNWQEENNFPFYVFDTSVSQQTYNQYLLNGIENYNVPEEYTFNLGNKQNNHITIQGNPSPNALNTMYSVSLKYTATQYFNDAENLETTSDYEDYFKVTSTGEGEPVTTASNKRQEHLASKLEKQRSLPLIFKETQSLTMQDMDCKKYTNSNVPYGFEKLEHTYTDLISSYDTYNEAYDFAGPSAVTKVYDKLSISFRAKKIDGYQTSTSLAFILGHTSVALNEESIQYPGSYRTAKHSVLMYRMNPNPNLNASSKYYLDNGAQSFSLEYLVYYEVNNEQIEIVELFSSMPFDVPTIFDGYLHTFNFFHDKANMMIYVDVDNSLSNVVSLSNLTYQGIGLEGEIVFDVFKAVDPLIAYPGPVKMGILSANLDIDIRRMSSANQGFYEPSGSKLVLSPNFKYVTKNINLPYANVINLGLISQDDITLKYYLNGVEQLGELTEFTLALGSNKLEVYAYCQTDLVDRFITYVYYYPASSYSEDYKFSDYRVIYSKDSGSNESITIRANSFYFDGDMSIGKSQTLLHGRYDNFMNFLILENENEELEHTPLIYYYDDPADIEGTKVLINGKPEFVTPTFNVIEPMNGNTTDPYGYNESPGRDTGRLFKFEPFDTNISNVSMTFKLFESKNLLSTNGSRELIEQYSEGETPTLLGIDGGFQVSKELTKVTMRLYYNSNSNRSILITNELETPGIYYEEGVGNVTLIQAVTFTANKDYRVILLKDTTGSSILLYEDTNLIYKAALDMNKVSLLGNKFETKFTFGRAIIKDIVFNYTHDVNQDRLIKYGTQFINALEETQIDALDTTQEIEEFRQISERNILETGFANLKYKYNNAEVSAKSTISIVSLINENNLTFEISSTSLDFTYKGESSNSVVQSKTISLLANTEYAIKISLGEQTTVDSASLPVGLVNVSSGPVDCVPVYFDINGVSYTFYMPDKGAEQSSWNVKYKYSEASYYIMKMTFDDLIATVSDFGIYRQRNFDFVGYTIPDMPLNEI